MLSKKSGKQRVKMCAAFTFSMAEEIEKTRVKKSFLCGVYQRFTTRNDVDQLDLRFKAKIEFGTRFSLIKQESLCRKTSAEAARTNR